MDQFLERYNLPNVTQWRTGNQNSPIFITEIEPTIDNLPKIPVPGDFTGAFYQIFREH